jgi:hypothetical protein
MIATAQQKNSVLPFIILSSQRSGSTFIRIWLNRHSQIHSYGEVFLGHYKSADGFRAFCENNFKSKLLFKLGHTRLAKALPVQAIPGQLVKDYLNVLYDGKNHPAPWTDIDERINTIGPRIPKPVIGFKVMYNTLLQYPILDDWIMKRCPHVIHLTRNNLLRKYVSEVRMNITHVAHQKETLKTKPKITVNIDKFLEYADTQTAFTKKYRDQLPGHVPYLEISYEDFFSNNTVVRKNILDFLELENEEMPFHSMKKIGSSQLGDDIQNWGEVVECLADTPYSVFL